MSEPGQVLIADECAVSRQVAAAMVEHLGWRSTTVADGSAAIRQAMSTTFGLVLLSSTMPGFGGVEDLSRLRALQQGRRTTILAIAGVDDLSDVPGGFDGFLRRPLTLTAVNEALYRWTTTVPPGRPVLDASVVAAVTKIGADLGEDLWAQLVELFLADAGSWLPAMRTAASTVDAGALFRSAHTLSGASANLGASHLAALCSTLAEDRVVQDLQGTSEAVDAVEVELARVVAALRSSLVGGVT